MSTFLLLGLGIASGAIIARRATNYGPGGSKLFMRRQILKNLNGFKLLSNAETASTFNELKMKYTDLVIPEPVILSGTAEKDDKVLYYGPFKTNMTKKEARLVIGLSPSESKDKKAVNSQFRRLMLKNHPDTGGSLYLASKINEAKDILIEGKKAEDGEEENFVVDVESVEAKDDLEESKKKKKEKLKSMMNMKGFNPEELINDDIETIRRPKSKIPKTERQMKEDILNEDIDFRPRKMALDDDYETIFERKMNRIYPVYNREDHTDWQPEENWKFEYLQRMKSLKRLEKFAKKNQFKIEQYDDGSYMVMNGDKKPLRLRDFYYEEEGRMKGEIPEMESFMYEQYDNYEKEQEEIFRLQLDQLKASKKRMTDLEEMYKPYIEEYNKSKKDKSS